MTADSRRDCPVVHGVLIIFALCILHAPARAQSGSAEALYAEGYRLMKAGKLAEACEAFEASNRAEPGAGTYLALGDCRARNHQFASAWSAYSAALTRAKDLSKQRAARTKVAELAPRLSDLTVSVPADAPAGLTLTRNGTLLDSRLWNRALPIDGGDYVLEARAPGREPWTTTVHVPEQRGKVEVRVPELAKVVVPPPPPEPGWSTRRKVAVGMVAAGVVVVAVGGVLGSMANHDRDEARAICPREVCERAPEARELIASSRSLAISADVAFGVAGAAVITAGVLWFTGGQETRQGIAIAPHPLPGGFAVTATRSF